MALTRFLLQLLSLSSIALLIGASFIFGQEPAKCRLEGKENKTERAPKYRVGWTTHSVEGPNVLFLAISIDPRHFSREEMVAIARRIKRDFCQDQRLNVEIFDDYQAARSFAPTIEKEWFQKHWRGTYLLDRCSGIESINYSTAPGKSRDEIKINLDSSPP